MITRRRLIAALLVCLLPPVAGLAGWLEVWQAGMELDLEKARELALETIATDPTSADAVAAASWWLANVEDLPEPEEVLAIADADRDPEVAFIVERVGALLGSRPPAGALVEAELSGPFGVFSTIDLEREVVPPDHELPAVGTRWSDPATPFRLLMRSADALHGPPQSMIADGVYLVSWTLQAADAIAGWLVVEARGGYNLSLDGRAVDQRRHCARVDPGTVWYRLRLAPGPHRLRIEIASPEDPQVRVSLLDERGLMWRSTCDPCGDRKTSAV